MNEEDNRIIYWALWSYVEEMEKIDTKYAEKVIQTLNKHWDSLTEDDQINIHFLRWFKKWSDERDKQITEMLRKLYALE